MAKRKKRKAAAPRVLDSSNDPLLHGVSFGQALVDYQNAASSFRNQINHPQSPQYIPAQTAFFNAGNTLSLIAAFHPEFFSQIQQAFNQAVLTLNRA